MVVFAGRAAVRSAIGTIVTSARHNPVAPVVTSAVTCVPVPIGAGVPGNAPTFVGGAVAGSVGLSGALVNGTVAAGAVVHVPLDAKVSGTGVSAGSGVGIRVAVGTGVGIALGVPVGVAFGVAVAVGVGAGAGTVMVSASGTVAFPGKIEAIRDGSAGETKPTVKSTAQATTPAVRSPLSMPWSSMEGRPGDGTPH